MLYKRQLYSSLEAELDTKEITVITGMRRVGKTTALHHLYDLVLSENKAMLDLENPIHRKIFEEENYDTIWNNLQQFGIKNTSKSYIFIDEVQNLPELSRAVKYLYDHWEVKFFLTGSSSYYLRNLFPESLAGRKMLFELFPLTFAEYLVFKQIDNNRVESFEDKAQRKNKIAYQKLLPFYDEYMEYGGFPSVVLEENRERKRLMLSEIFTSYFEKDAKNLADFRDMSKLRDLILLLVPRVGSRIEVAKLANELSVSRDTIYNYLSFLEQTYFVTLLPRYSTSIDRQAAGSRKLYFCDSGIVNVLGRLSQGQLFEQSVFQNLRHVSYLSYYSKAGSSEIDFIANSTDSIEVKFTMSGHDIAVLNRRSKQLLINNSYIITHQYVQNSEAIMATDL